MHNNKDLKHQQFLGINKYIYEESMGIEFILISAVSLIFIAMII